MARPLWTGSLSFGLVNVPVSMFSGVRDLDLHFRQLHETDGAPIDVQRWCSEEDVEVPFEEITRSYELEDGRELTVSDQELEAIEPRRTRTVDIEQFVEVAAIEPIYYEHPYWLVPAGDDDGGARAYRLLTAVMERTKRAALGRFVMRAKEHLAIIRAQDSALSLTTMRFAEEVRDPDDVDNAAAKTHKPSGQQLDAAVAVIEELSTEWEPERHRDCYRERLERVVARKRKGETVTVEEDGAEPEPMPDLMAALERTLQQIKREPQEAR